MRSLRGHSAMAAIVLGIAGCGGGSSVQPAFSPQEQKVIAETEAAPQKELLESLEKQYGPDHPEVQQMKMSMGLDANTTPSGQPKQ